MGNNSLCIAFSYTLFFHICPFAITPCYFGSLLLWYWCLSPKVFIWPSITSLICFSTYFSLLTFRPWTMSVRHSSGKYRKTALFICVPQQTKTVCHVSRSLILFVKGKSKSFQSHPVRSHRSYLYFHTTSAFFYCRKCL